MPNPSPGVTRSAASEADDLREAARWARFAVTGESDPRLYVAVLGLASRLEAMADRREAEAAVLTAALEWADITKSEDAHGDASGRLWQATRHLRSMEREAE